MAWDDGSSDSLTFDQRATCTGEPPAGDDGDLLPAERDEDFPFAELAGCNPLLYREEFASNRGEWFFRRDVNTVDSSCFEIAGGELQQRCNAADNVIYQAFARDPQLPTLSYLVEVEVTIDEVLDARRWEIGLLARLEMPPLASEEPFQYIGCFIRKDTGINPGVGLPELVVELRRWWGDFTLDYGSSPGSTAYWNEMASGFEAPTFSTAPGARHVLQLFVAANNDVYCVLSDQQEPYARAGSFRVSDLSGGDYSSYVNQAAGSVGVQTLNAAASFDNVRVFELSVPSGL